MILWTNTPCWVGFHLFDKTSTKITLIFKSSFMLRIGGRGFHLNWSSVFGIWVELLSGAFMKANQSKCKRKVGCLKWPVEIAKLVHENISVQIGCWPFHLWEVHKIHPKRELITRNYPSHANSRNALSAQIISENSTFIISSR